MYDVGLPVLIYGDRDQCPLPLLCRVSVWFIVGLINLSSIIYPPSVIYFAIYLLTSMQKMHSHHKGTYEDDNKKSHSLFRFCKKI